MADTVRVPSETTRLVNSHIKTVKLSKARKVFSRLSPGAVCIRSQPVALILAWTFVIGAIYEGFGIASHLAIPKLSNNRVHITDTHIYLVMGAYIIVTIANLFYPLGGLLADVYCGRCRIVIGSLCCLWLCLLLVTILAAVHVSTPDKHTIAVKVGGGFLIFSSFLMYVPAFAGYTSNIVQFGFDQLLDRPSQSLGMFVHWFAWAQALGITVVHVFNAFVECVQEEHTEKIMNSLLYFSPLFFLIVLSILLLLTLVIRHSFYTERITENPYKLILSIINFARKNKNPVGRPSAFVYTYHRRPTRFDFAKEVYGGPFKNSDVDDVRVFMRVLLVLFALGPVFTITVSNMSMSTIFSLFALHTGKSNFSSGCSAKWLLLESGNLSYLTTVFLMPVYIWVVYGVMRNRVPKILTRLGLFSVLYVIAATSLPFIDIIGHSVRFEDTEGEMNMTCLFFQDMKNIDPLHLSWWVLVPPNLLLNIVPRILLATVLEFISAQGPHTMKGVLVGLLFAISGFYQVIGAGLVYPFSIQIWKKVARLYPIISCEFGYFTVTVLIALVGVLCFVVSACKYKYRIRGEEEFNQQDVEEVFERRIRLEEEYQRGLSEQELMACQEQTQMSYTKLTM